MDERPIPLVDYAPLESDIAALKRRVRKELPRFRYIHEIHRTFRTSCTSRLFKVLLHKLLAHTTLRAPRARMQTMKHTSIQKKL